MLALLLTVPLLLCAPAALGDDVSGKPVAYLGGLFPFTNHPAGAERAAAARVAVEMVNADAALLPDVELRILLADTEKSPTGGLRAALEMTNPRANDGALAFGLVGAASSSVSVSIAGVAALFHLTQCSYSSTSPALSNKLDYPYFARTVPSDGVGGLAWAVLLTHYGWKEAAIVSTTDTYGTGGRTSFMQAATHLGVDVLSAPAIAAGTVDAVVVSEAVEECRGSGARVIVLHMLSRDAQKVLLAAHELGMYGVDPATGESRYQWVFSDGPAQDELLAVRSADVSGAAPGDNVDAAAADAAAVALTAAGSLGVVPKVGVDGVVNGTRTFFAEYLDEWERRNASTYPGAGDRTMNGFAPFAADCVFTFARALHELIGAGVVTATVGIPSNSSSSHASTIDAVDVAELPRRLLEDDALGRRVREVFVSQRFEGGHRRC